MLPLVIWVSAMLVGQEPPKVLERMNPPPVAPKAEATPEKGGAEALTQYNGMRDKVAETGAAHWKMALWCEQNGLPPESYFHLGRVIELEPKRDAAWIKLGFKKHDGHWMTPQQIAAEDAQKKAGKDWAVKIKKIHKEIHVGTKKDEARAALDAIVDPTAAPSVYREFCGGSAVDQAIGVQALSQIEGEVASHAIAILSVYGKSPAVRRHATEVLRGRPPEEFLEMLVSLMKDLLKYEVKPVGGPGSPGVLFVEGERFNARRFYAPPPPPTYIPRPGDLITYDDNGQPVVSRFSASTSLISIKGIPGSKTLVRETDQQIITIDTYSLAVARAEAQRAAANAQAQLAGDIAQIDWINEARSKFNDLVMSAAQAATGKSPGRTAKQWRDLLAGARNGRSAPIPRRAPMKPTLDQMVPLDYLPNFADAMTRQYQARVVLGVPYVDS